MYQEAFVCTLVLEYVCIIRDLCMWTYVLTGMCVKTRTSLFISTETCLALFFLSMLIAQGALFSSVCVFIFILFMHLCVCVCVYAWLLACRCVCACVRVWLYVYTYRHVFFFFVWNLVRQIHPVVGETFPTAKCIRYSNKIHTAFK